MAPKYKLTYTNRTGLGERIRYLFAYGKIDFEDFRFDRTELENYKKDTPFGKFPVLEVDGKQYSQSSAICRYLAKLTGLAGKTDLDALQADMIVDTLVDLQILYMSLMHELSKEEDQAKKAKKVGEFAAEHNPFYFERFEKIVNENGGHFVNNQLTWADLVFASIAELLCDHTSNSILDKYSGLKALKEKVENLPGIKEYRANRPKNA